MKKQVHEGESSSGTADESGHETHGTHETNETSKTGSSATTAEKSPASQGATAFTYLKDNEKVTGEEAGSLVFPPLALPMPLPGAQHERLDAAPEHPPPLDFDMPLPSPPESRQKSEEKPVIEQPPAPKQRRGVFKFPFFKNGVTPPPPHPQQDEATTTTAELATSSQLAVSVFPESSPRKASFLSRITRLVNKKPPEMKQTLAAIPEDHVPAESMSTPMYHSGMEGNATADVEQSKSTPKYHSGVEEPFVEHPPVQVFQAMAGEAQNPDIWFHQVEVRFSLYRIASERTRSYHVASVLAPDVARELFDVLSNPSDSTPYQHLKTNVLERFAPSERARLQQLLAEGQFGDRRPSQLLRLNATASLGTRRLYPLSLASRAVPPTPFPANRPRRRGGRRRQPRPPGGARRSGS
ncbi:hypothetical protein MTO96_008373 [Rhipicephalus appendiculatus]